MQTARGIQKHTSSKRGAHLWDRFVRWLWRCWLCGSKETSFEPIRLACDLLVCIQYATLGIWLLENVCLALYEIKHSDKILLYIAFVANQQVPKCLIIVKWVEIVCNVLYSARHGCRRQLMYCSMRSVCECSPNKSPPALAAEVRQASCGYMHSWAHACSSPGKTAFWC